MAKSRTQPSVLDAELTAIFREESAASRRGRRVPRSSHAAQAGDAPRSGRRLPGWLWFIGGLLIGWLVIGWFLWPVQWTNSQPWDMSGLHQKQYLQLVADRYWFMKDLTQVDQALDGWNKDDVNNLLVDMQTEVFDPQARQRLAALSTALSLPGGEQSLVESILGEGGILIAFAAAAVPLLLAVGLVLMSKLRASPKGEEVEFVEESEASLEELLADVQLDGGAGGGPGSPQAGGGNPDEQGQPGDANQNPEQTKPAEEQPQEDEEERSAEGANPLGDLASLFEEEDTSLATLEAMCKGLPDTPADDLLKTARELVRRFKEEKRKD